MEKTLVTILVALALIIGAVGGAVFAPAEVETKEIEKIVYQNVSVTEFVEVIQPSALDNAIEVFKQAVEDEEDQAGNKVDVLGNYNYDELEVSKVYDDYLVSYDEDITTVNFSIKLKLDDGDDRVRETYDVSVTQEDGEDSIVIVA